MSEQIREQVSAFLDGELPGSETELLLKRLTRDAELRESFGRYALVGECLRGGGSHARLSQSFPGRVNRAIDGEPPAPAVFTTTSAAPRWWRPFAGAAVAAGVAAVAVVALQQRSITPTVQAPLPHVTARNVAAGKATEALSYTVPDTVSGAVSEAPGALPSARLTNYVFAHSKYSSVLGHSNVLSDLLAGGDRGTIIDASATGPATGNTGATAPQVPRVAP